MSNNWLDIDVLEDYLDGKLDAKAMHFVERQALDDPFVAEALEGLRQSPKRKQVLSTLQKKLYDRVAEKPAKRRLWGITTQRLSIAATATVAFIVVSILFFMRENNRKNAELNAKRAKGVEVTLDSNIQVATIPNQQNGSASHHTNKKADSMPAQAINKAKTNELAINKNKPYPRLDLDNAITTKQTNRSSAVESEAKPLAINASEYFSKKKFLKGKVVDESNGEPLPGVGVIVQGAKQRVSTDENGYFLVPIDSGKATTLAFSGIGYENTNRVVENQNELNVKLKPQNSMLNEVVVSSLQKSKNLPNSSGKVVFSGEVVDEKSGKPVSGAVVRLAGAKAVTTTDDKGAFVLRADSSERDKNLVINAVGFKEVPVAGLTNPNAVKNALTGNKSLQEIALITGSNGQKKAVIEAPKIKLQAIQNLNGKADAESTKPIPVSTIDYQQYLEQNNKLIDLKAKAKYVIVGFKVKVNGRPTNVKIIKSLGNKADAEAKRLILEGPDWVLPKNGVNTVEMSIRF